MSTWPVCQQFARQELADVKDHRQFDLMLYSRQRHGIVDSDQNAHLR